MHLCNTSCDLLGGNFGLGPLSKVWLLEPKDK